MSDRITKEEALEFRARWAAVNSLQAEETRRTSFSDRLRQLEALVVSGRALGWEDASSTGEEEVRDRWTLLRRRCGL
jgi:hypothetical protein